MTRRHPRDDRRTNAFSNRARLAVISVTGAALAMIPFRTYETWLHLAVGRRLVHDGVVPSLEVFGNAASASSPADPSLLFGALLYGSHVLAGEAGPTLLQMVFAAGTLALLYREVRTTCGPLTTTAITLLACFPAVVAAQPIPGVVLPFLLVTDTYLLSTFVRAGGRRVYFVVVVQLAWVYLDCSALLGPMIVFVWLAANWLRRRRASDSDARTVALTKTEQTLLGLLLTTLACCIATPWGWSGVEAMAAFFLEPGARGLPVPVASAWCVLILLTALCVIGLAASQPQMGDFFGTRICLAAAGASLAIVDAAHLPMACLLAAPAAGAAISRFGKRVQWTRSQAHPARAWGGVLALCLAAGTLRAATSVQQGAGLGPRQDTFAEPALHYLVERQIDGRVFAASGVSGYLTWHLGFERCPLPEPELGFGREVLRAAAARRGPQFAAVVEQMDATVAVLPFPRLRLQHQPGAQLSSLWTHATDNLPAGWVLLYWDDLALIVARVDAIAGGPAAGDPLRSLRPLEDYYLWDTPRQQEPSQRTAIAADTARVVERSPQSLRAGLTLAKLAYYDGSLDSAHELVTGILERASEQPRYRDVRHAAYRLLALVAEARGDHNEAIASLRRMISVDPQLSGWAYFRLGRLLEAQGRVQDAIDTYSAAVEANPHIAEAHARLSELLVSRGDLYGAFRALMGEGAARRRLVAADSFQQGLRFYQAGDLIRAERAFRASLETNPRSAPAHCNLGYVLYDLGRYDEALKHQTEALRTEPDHANAHFGLGLIYRVRGNGERAIEHFQRFIELDPSSPFADKARIQLQEVRRGVPVRQ